MEAWTGEGCLQVVYLAQLTLGAGVVAATLLQFVGALWVRDYARVLWVRGWRDEESRVAMLSALDEEVEEEEEEKF